MQDSIRAFFDAWAIDSAAARRETLMGVMTTEARYDDPRTTQSLTGIDDICDYIGQFSTNAPGWSANLLSCETRAGVSRATVEFSGPGPDGQTMSQHGQYFIEGNDSRIVRLVGFVGIGLDK